MAATILTKVIYRTNRSRNICELYDSRSGRFLTVGIGDSYRSAEISAFNRLFTLHPEFSGTIAKAPITAH